MKAVELALLAYHKHFQMKAIHFQIDNTTILSYVVKMGRTKNKYLMELSKEIWKYLLHHGITITAEYLPSSTDVEADWQSINSKDHSEWKLLPQVFQRICQIKGKPEMDLFASRLFHGTPNPYSQRTNAMQQIWSNQYLNAFPPFLMIKKVLRKIVQHQVKQVLIVAPTW